jgi:hypothetical protein
MGYTGELRCHLPPAAAVLAACARSRPPDLDPTPMSNPAACKPPWSLDLDPMGLDRVNPSQPVKPCRPRQFCRKPPKFSDIHKNTLPP